MFVQLRTFYSSISIPILSPLSSAIWRSGEGNARDYGSSAAGPLFLPWQGKVNGSERSGRSPISIAAGRENGCLLLRTDPHNVWLEASHLMFWMRPGGAEGSGGGEEKGGSLPVFTVNVPMLMKLLRSAGLLRHASLSVPSPHPCRPDVGRNSQ